MLTSRTWSGRLPRMGLALRVAPILLGLLLGLVAGCGPSAPSTTPKAGVICANAPRCEQAIVEAKPADRLALIETYTSQFAPAWGKVFAAMKAAEDGVVVLGEGGTPWPGAPQSVAADALLMAFGRAAKVRHLFVDEGSPRQLFPLDPLDSLLGVTDPVLAADPTQRDHDRKLARRVREAFAAADAFDYVGASGHADQLHDLLAMKAGSREARWRARLAYLRMRWAGVAVEPPDSDEDDGEDDGDDGDDATPIQPGSTAYADLIALLLDPEGASQQARMERVVKGVADDRRAAVRASLRPAASCPDPFLPPMERPADVFFADRMAGALDAGAAPGAPPAAGKLGLTEWSRRYITLVDFVETGHPWLHIGSLLQQRGELDGLSPASSDTYKRVTALGKRHVEAIRKLVAAEPERVDAVGLMALVYRPGAVGDPILRRALGTLVRDAVMTIIGAADDPGEVFTIAGAAFLGSTSLPGPFQAEQLKALREALDGKLGGDFGTQSGWAVAGLHVGHAAMGLIFGDPDWLTRGAPRVERALAPSGDGSLPYPQLAALAKAGVHYVELSAAGQLDAAALNPLKFPLVRTEAKRKLQASIEQLASPGPASASERDLARMLADMGDGLIALSAAKLMKDEAGPSCRNRDQDPHAKSWQTMRQRQKRLLQQPVFKGQGDGPWPRRARLLGLLLSDLTDAMAPATKGAATVAGVRAEAIAKQGLDGWVDSDVALTAAAGYLLLRRMLGGELDGDAVVAQSVELMKGLSALFEEQDGGLFGTLATVGDAVEGRATQGDLSTLLSAYADRAYAQKAETQGDILMMLALSTSLANEEPVPDAAIDVARTHGRPVLLPLLMYSRTAFEGGNPAPMLEAMKNAGKLSCNPPDPAMVIAVRRAIYDFRKGERKAAVASLDRVVADATRKGLVVPRQTFSYLQRAGTRYLSAKQSISLGSHLLARSGTFNVGLGYLSNGPEGGELEVELSGADTPDALKEAARYYAHAAALSSAYHFALGDDDAAVKSARVAVGAWANGVKLGEQPVPVGGETGTWAGDATATIAVIAQRAADRGHALLAGDLWTLARASLDEDAEDEDIDAVFDPVPVSLRDVPELKDVIPRAKEGLAVVAAPLACTGAEVDLSKYRSVGCDAYPLALAFRVAAALPELPRLKKGAETGHPGCGAWRKLDGFLAAVDEGRYEPDLFVAAVTSLQNDGHPQDAATLMARQRHPKHCTPGLVDMARTMAKDPNLGLHLRADVLSVAANCGSATPTVDKDLVALDELTQKHALPTRNFEVLVFAARLALVAGRYEPLYRITHQPNFVRRYQRLGPDLGAAALLLFHAAAAGEGKPDEAERTAPVRRLLCSTYAEPRRAAMCNVIAQLVDPETANPAAVAKDALQRFIEEAVRQAGGTP